MFHLWKFEELVEEENFFNHNSILNWNRMFVCVLAISWYLHQFDNFAINLDRMVLSSLIFSQIEIP